MATHVDRHNVIIHSVRRTVFMFGQCHENKELDFTLLKLILLKP